VHIIISSVVLCVRVFALSVVHNAMKWDRSRVAQNLVGKSASSLQESQRSRKAPPPFKNKQESCRWSARQVLYIVESVRKPSHKKIKWGCSENKKRSTYCKYERHHSRSCLGEIVSAERRLPADTNRELWENHLQQFVWRCPLCSASNKNTSKK